LTVQATGDGKVYLLQLRTVYDQLYVQRFTTVAEVEKTYPHDHTANEHTRTHQTYRSSKAQAFPWNSHTRSTTRWPRCRKDR
jgi:hypothetical protein